MTATVQGGNATVEAAGADAVLLRAIAVAVLLALLAVGVYAAVRRPATSAPRMTAMEHVEELRRRLLVALVAWVTGTAAAFGLRIETTARIPYPVPALHDNLAAQAFRAMADALVPDGVSLVVTGPFDGFLAEFTVALGLGFALALPAIVWQAGAYITPALQERERRAVRRAFVPALVLFAAGVWFGWRFVLPFALDALYGYAAALGAQQLLHISEFVSFTVVFLAVFGLAFQLPLVMYALARAGLVTPAGFLAKWRHATVGILIVSAVITDPTIVSQVLVAGPLLVLYFLGVGAAQVARVRRG